MPVLAFVVAALAGHVAISGDNPVQAYPLRELSGQILASGHLPTWDPYIWSGTPLLAGFNAGSLFPATALFSLLSPVPAWVATEIAVFVVCDLGFYAFLRATGRSVGASFLASATFSFAGVMTSQFGHIDLVQAVALAPWILLALYRMAEAEPGDGAWRWVLLLGASFTLLILAGDPEAMLDLAVLAGIYALALVAGHPRHGGRILGQTALALAAAIAVGAVQWLPGLVWASGSQRAVTSYAFFGSGSLPPALSVLMVAPFLLGGYGALGQPTYFGPYNLAEINAYVGILPLIAAFALLGLPRHASLGRRRSGQARWVWYLVIAVGVVLSLGSYTPLGHLLHHLPLYGQQRTQSRNLVDVDVGLAVLLALWLDRVRSRPPWPARLPGGPPNRARLVSPLLGLVPVAAVLVLWVAFIAAPGAMVRAVAGAGYSLPPGAAPLIRRYLTELAAVAVLAGAVAVGIHRWPAAWRVSMIGVVVATDLVLFGLNEYTFESATPSVLADSSPAADAVARATGPLGRFAVYDPSADLVDDLFGLGVADLNVLRRLGSVGGYGSLLGARYADVTGTHQFAGLAPSALADGTMDQLDLRVLAAPPEAFIEPARTAAAPAGPPSHGQPGLGQPGPVPVVGPRSVAPGASTSWFFGGGGEITGVSMADLAPTTVANPGTAAAIQVGLLQPSGSVVWSQNGLAASAPGTETASFSTAVTAVGVVVVNQTDATQVVSAPEVAISGYGAFLLHGDLSDAVSSPDWRFSGYQDGFGLFTNTKARGPFWLAPPKGSSAVPAGQVRLVTDTIWGAQTVEVTTPGPVTLVRSVVDAPGWVATIRPAATGPTRPAQPVTAVGLVQGVRVPAGRWLVSFDYRPASVSEGEAISLAGLAGSALVAAGLAAWRHRRRLFAGPGGSVQG